MRRLLFPLLAVSAVLFVIGFTASAQRAKRKKTAPKPPVIAKHYQMIQPGLKPGEPMDPAQYKSWKLIEAPPQPVFNPYRVDHTVSRDDDTDDRDFKLAEKVVAKFAEVKPDNPGRRQTFAGLDDEDSALTRVGWGLRVRDVKATTTGWRATVGVYATTRTDGGRGV
jgi:hypothetical protein